VERTDTVDFVQCKGFQTENSEVDQNKEPCMVHNNMQNKLPNKVILVDSRDKFQKMGQLDLFQNGTTSKDIPTATKIVAVDCEGIPGNLFLVQIATTDVTHVLDCVKLGVKTVCDFLYPMLQDGTIVKYFHDLHNDVAAFSRIGGIHSFSGTFDTQLACEFKTGNYHMGFYEMLELFGQPTHPTKHSMKWSIERGSIFGRRPLAPEILAYAADNVKLLVVAHESIHKSLGKETWRSIQMASDARANAACKGGKDRQICFDAAQGCAIASFELLHAVRPKDVLVAIPLEVSNDTSTVISMLPNDLQRELDGNTQNLFEIVLDKGRQPYAWVRGERQFLGGDNRIVESSEIEAIVEQLGGFGTDNRAGLERQLHRISAIRNRESDIIGLTMRIGRHVSGNANIISDLLLGYPTSSILFLGEPGSGKTTVVREVTRLLAERCNVCIVDTSNEIAGDGDISHPCVGLARRMMVPSLDRQGAVMVECVQNHTPEVMVIDEIGRSTEVEAARTCKTRGVRLVASCHGDLRKLIKNPKLRGLIGGIENVTLGDEQAKKEAEKHNSTGGISKLKAQRAGPPTFEILVELQRHDHNVWRIVLDSADAVDRIFDGQQYLVQRRTRDPLTNAIRLAFEKA
jgi:stage III sporulation protein SpoIIIAA